MSDVHAVESSTEIFRGDQQAGRFCGVSASYIKKRRRAGTGPECVKLSPRCLLYSRAALERWLAEHSHGSPV
jgi:hypothetical protein